MAKLTNTQKDILDENTQALVEAGFLSSDLKLTDSVTHYLRHLAFVANKVKLVARAKEIIEEREEECKKDCEEDAE